MSDHTIEKNIQGVGVWEHFTVRDGLSDMKIESLFVDSKGILWVGTHDCGVARLDGYSFTVYTHRDGLAGDRVCSILEDREGALWFGTDRGLTLYYNREFKLMVPGSGERHSFIWGRCMDRQGALWFGLEGQPGSPLRICRWDGKSLDLIQSMLYVENSGVTRIVAGTKGGLWIGSGDGLFYYDGETFHCITAPSGQFGFIRALLPRSDGSLWIAGETSSGRGLYVYADEQVELLLEDDKIIALLEVQAGIVWITTYDGRLLCYKDGTFQLIQKLCVRFWRDLCLDKTGRLWMGTYGMGLYCYDTTRFVVFQEKQGFPGNQVYCLTEDNTGALLAGTQRGIVKYDGTIFHPLEETGELTNKSVTALLRDRQDHIWIGTLETLYRYEGRSLQSVPLPPKTPLDCHLGSLAEDQTGRIWFGFRMGYGFGYYESSQVQRFLDERDVAYPGYVQGLIVDRQGAVWIGSWNPARWEGLCRYDGQNFTAFTSADGLTGGAILALYEDRDGILWVGSSTGVSCYDGTHFSIFTKEDGLPHEIVTAIIQTKDGTLWFGTEGGGVCRYDRKVFQVLTIPGDLGLNVIHAIYQDRQGQVWFGTEDGLVRYIPKRERPEVAITEVIADQTYDVTQEIEISTTGNRVSFCFQGRSPIERASHLVYRYRLEGYDHNWQQTQERQVDYLQLPLGEYRFMVQVVDSDLNYSDVAQVRLAVTPDPRSVGLTEALRTSVVPGDFVGTSPALRKILEQIQEVAQTDLTVLILGETGTGKGLVARAIHGLSSRQQGPFVQVNCGAIAEGLVESELFGHEKGAFTGAISRKLGRFELSEGGTLFLDEIGDLALTAQVKLLRFLEERTFERVGGEKILRADVRVIAATNRDLEEMVREGKFREDLYFRVRTFPIQVPPLRERKEDIPLLVRYFAQRFAQHLNRPVSEVTAAALERLQEYSWPGNVRELEHLVQRAVLLCKNHIIKEEDIAVALSAEHLSLESRVDVSPEEYERRWLEGALEATGWTIYGPRGAAKLLRIHPEKLRTRMKKYGLRRPW